MKSILYLDMPTFLHMSRMIGVRSLSHAKTNTMNR